MNVQAAHLWPDSWLGPLRPSNGILLSLDLHWAFDIGQFTIDNDYSYEFTFFSKKTH